MKNRILQGYKKQSDADFAQLANRIVTKMKDEPLLPNPPEELKALGELLPTFRTAVVHASGRGRNNVAIKNDIRVKMEAQIAIVADYVSRVANGDLTTLLSSGFDISGTKKVNDLRPIGTLEVKIDNPKEAVTKVKRVRGARAYIHQYTPEPLTNTSTWTTKVLAVNTHTFTGLQSKERYLFQVIAIGSKGQEVFSPVVARVIQ
jgi:hypothetical protein